MSTPRVAVIILNWNGYQDTLECLKTVTKSSTISIDLSIYLIDNASSDGSVTKLKNKFPKINYLQNDKNLGYSRGNNVGIKQALADGADFVILLNNDTTVRKNTFSNLVSGAQQHHFDIASPKIYFYPGREFHHQDYKASERGKIIWYAGGRIDWPNVINSHIGVNEFDHGQFDQAQTTDFASGCCMLIHKSVVNKIGLLSPAYRAYYEDADFCVRAQRHGFTVGIIPDSLMWHKNAGSTGGSGSSQQAQIQPRSRLIFALKHAPFRAKLALIKHQLLH